MHQLLAVITLALTLRLAATACPRPPDCYVCSSSSAICKVCPDHPDIPATITDLKIISGGCSILAQMGLLKTTSFSRFTDIKTLSMDHTNVIRFFGSVFEKNVNLEKLSLAQNSIRGFSAQTFKGLGQLRELILAQNKIAALSPSSFSLLISLETLNLVGNLLTHLSAHDFDGLSNLVTLSLSNNPLNTIEPDSFKPLTNVQEVVLKGTELTAIPARLLAGLAALRRVDASGGKIRVVADDSLIGTHLDTLDLSRNALIAAPYAAIKNSGTPPKNINLSFNRIIRLFAHDFHNVSTAKLDLQSNPISLIEAGAFSGSAITELNLANTSLTSLPLAMEAWMLKQKVNISLQDNTGWLCSCSQLWLSRYLQGVADKQSPNCAAGGTYGGKTLVSVLSQIESDCRTTTSTTTTTTTTSTSISTVATSTATTTTPTTATSTLSTSTSRKPSKQTSQPAVLLGTIITSSARPPGQSFPPINSNTNQPNGHTGPGTTQKATNTNTNNNSNNNNGRPNTSNANGNSNTATASPSKHTTPNTGPTSHAVQNPGSGNNGIPSRSSPSSEPGAKLPGGGISPPGGQPLDHPAGQPMRNAHGTVNMMAVLLAVLCTLAACLFCVGVVAACLSCNRYKHRRGRVEDQRTNQVAHALAALSGKWHKEM